MSTNQIHAQYAADFSDDRILIGSSHNVFVGKVVRQIGNKERGIGPETQFEVEVVEVVKGDVDGIVIVNQQGGIKDGTLYVIGDDIYARANGKDYLLQPGETYLLATRYNETENWHTLNFHPNASKLISKDKNANKVALKELAVDDEKVKKLKKAYENEILIDADVKNNNTRNSYKSLQEKKEKEAKEEEGLRVVAEDEPVTAENRAEIAPAVQSETSAVSEPAESISTTSPVVENMQLD